MLSDGTWTYTWQNGRQLASMTNGTTTATFTYDGDGLRTSKTANGKTWQYIYNGSNLVQITDGTNTLHFYYDASGVMGVNYNGTDYFYLKNIQGDVIAIATSSGTVVAEYTYDAWGNPLTTTGSMASTLGAVNPLRYRSYVYDTETGLYYLQSRYYSPRICRFVNTDNIVSGVGNSVQGANMFAYCLNNPVNKVDHLGNKPGDLFDTINAAAIDFGNYINIQSIKEDREYASYIYTVTVTETIVTPVIERHRNFWYSWQTTTYVETQITKTKYTYKNPKKGKQHEVYMPLNWFNKDKKVAEIHTHGADSPGYNDHLFSKTDKNSWLNFLVTPYGTLRKYYPESKTDIIIYWDIPTPSTRN